MLWNHEVSLSNEDESLSDDNEADSDKDTPLIVVDLNWARGLVTDIYSNLKIKL